MTGGSPPPGGAGDAAVPPTIDDRIAERRRDVRRERQTSRRRRTVTVAASVLALVVFVLVERSPLVALESVEVVGTDRLAVEDVLAATQLEPGTSTLRLRLSRVEDRVRALALVAEVEASRLDPLSVRITVTEREPALVAVGDRTEVLVDRTGTVLEPGTIDGLPVVALPAAPPEVGTSGAEDGPLRGAVTVWRGLSGPLRAEVVRVTATAEVDLTLHLRSGVEVRFGPPTRLDEKVRAIGSVLEDVGDRPISAIDVTAPTRPVVVP